MRLDVLIHVIRVFNLSSRDRIWLVVPMRAAAVCATEPWWKAPICVNENVFMAILVMYPGIFVIK